MKYTKLIILTITIFLISGCVSYKELNEIGIINAIGIDYIDNEYELTVNILTPEKEDLELAKIYTANNSDIFECINDLYLISSKKIYLEHVNLLILSDNIKKDNYKDIFNLFLNRKDSRNSFNTIILENYNKNILTENVYNINNLIKLHSEEEGNIFPTTLDNVIKDVLEYDISFIPLLKNEEELFILGYKSIYNEDKKLSLDESKALNILKNNVKKTNIENNNNTYKVMIYNTTKDIKKNKIEISIISEISIIKKEDNNNSIKEYEEELKNLLNKFLENNNLNYFYNLIYKYDYNYYKKNKKFDIKFSFKLDTTLIEVDNIKGRDIFD